MQPSQHVFSGPKAILDYLCPGSCGPTPIVELPTSLNPYHIHHVRIFVKLMNQLPLNTVKSIPAWNMLSHLSESKKLSVDHLVEYSSGNTALSLTILGPHFGIRTTHALITADVPHHKKRLLQLIGTHLKITNGPSSPGVADSFGGIWNAKQLGQQPGWHNFNQYTCLDNPNGSEAYIGKELWEQLGNNLSIVVASIGTSGTIYGLGSYLKKKKSTIKIIGTSIKDGSSIPGPRGEVAVKKLAFPWQTVVDQEIAVTTVPSYELSLNMIRLGLFVGPSTGMQLAAIYEYFDSQMAAGTLHELKNNQGTIDVVFLAGDTMYPYVEDFFSHLPESYFPSIEE
jgi:cysteine synthase